MFERKRRTDEQSSSLNNNKYQTDGNKEMKIYEIITDLDESNYPRVWRVSDAKRVLTDIGYRFERAGKGSHEYWKHTETGDGFPLSVHGKELEYGPSKHLNRLLRDIGYVYIPEDIINETLGLGRLGAFIWTAFKAYNMAQPVITAWKNMKAANNALKRQEPGYTTEKVNAIVAHELAQCSATVATMFLGNKLLEKLVFGSFSFAGFSPAAAFFKETASVLGQAKFMEWVNSKEVTQIISDWLAGTLFSDQFPILDKSGPIYEKYVGDGLLASLRSARTAVDTVKDKVIKPSTTSSPEPGQGASTTPATAPSAGQERSMGSYMKSVPAASGDPNKFNITWKD